jgi:hypothetical protein
MWQIKFSQEICFVRTKKAVFPAPGFYKLSSTFDSMSFGEQFK